MPDDIPPLAMSPLGTPAPETLLVLHVCPGVDTIPRYEDTYPVIGTGDPVPDTVVADLAKAASGVLSREPSITSVFVAAVVPRAGQELDFNPDDVIDLIQSGLGDRASRYDCWAPPKPLTPRALTEWLASKGVAPVSPEAPRVAAAPPGFVYLGNGHFTAILNVSDVQVFSLEPRAEKVQVLMNGADLPTVLTGETARAFFDTFTRHL